MAIETERPTTVRTEIDDGIATILLDRPGGPVNLIDLDFIADLETAVDSLPADLNGLIIASAKPDQFLAGADLRQVLQAPTPDEASAATRRLQRVLTRIRNLPYPSVTAINGPALGGGLEIALACDYRVCVESDSPILGLSEVQLGLLPASGGTQYLPRLIGLSRALGLILQGRRYNARRASRYGVVDDVVHPTVLLPAARSWLARGKRASTPRWSYLDRLATRFAPVRAFIYRQAARGVQKETKGRYPAPFRALDAVRAGQERGVEAGLATEAAAFGELATGPVAHNLIHLFFAQEGLKAEQRPLARQAIEVDRVAVIGAGFMGAGIAQAAAVAGYPVRLRDVEPDRVAKGLAEARRLTRNAARRGRFSRTQARAIESRLTGTADDSGLAYAQLVIEAVFEDLALKRDVIANLERHLSPEAVIASNTSSLPIGALAAGAEHPERIVGMHFFSPVHRMPLLEVIRPDSASEEAIATAVTVGRRMGKTVIVVGDGPGFYTSRVLGAMLQQAGRLFQEGISIEAIDGATTAFGFPVGALALMDEVGLDVGAHVSDILHQAFPDRFPPAEPVERMIAAGRLGRKSGKGFYDYSSKHKRPDAGAYAFRDVAPTTMPREEIEQRLVLALVNEAVSCLDEGIIAGPRDSDVGAVFGFGFPPFLGGPFRWVDSQGPGRIVDQLRALEARFGPVFSPARGLVRLAETGSHFYSEI